MHAGLTSTTSDLERAARARLLSIALTAPDHGTVAEMRGLTAALAEGAPQGDPVHELAVALDDEHNLDELPFAYEELFGGEVACPPYEASYEGDPFRGTRQMSDAAGFYAAFGALPDGPAAERADHIACELEFVAFLAARRMTAAATGDSATFDRCAAAEDAFVREHLGRFMGALCGTIESTAGSPIYRAVGRVGSAFIAAELDGRGLTPPPVRRPRRSAVEADELVCGGACGAGGSGCGSRAGESSACSPDPGS